MLWPSPAEHMPLHRQAGLPKGLHGLMHPRNRQHVVAVAMNHQHRRAAPNIGLKAFRPGKGTRIADNAVQAGGRGGDRHAATSWCSG